MQRRMMAVLVLLMVAMATMAPGATMAAGRQAAPVGARPAAFAPTGYGCHVRGEDGYVWCGGAYNIGPNEQVKVCLGSATYNTTYSVSFILIGTDTLQYGVTDTLYAGPNKCAVLWWKNTTGRTVTVNLYANSNSYSYDQNIGGSISSTYVY